MSGPPPDPGRSLAPPAPRRLPASFQAVLLPALLPVLLPVLLLGAAGCGSKVVREPVYSAGGGAGDVESYLRRYESDGEPVSRGFDHPTILAPVRAAHMLAFLDVERGQGKDRETGPAVPPTLVYAVGEALAQGLEAAGPDDEVVVRAIRHERRFGIFSQRFLTSFLAYVMDDRLHVSFGHVDWEIPKFGPGRQEDELPEPVEGERQEAFRVLSGDAFLTLGPQRVAFDWRDERFRQPERVQLTPTGEVQRRTILLQGPAEPGEAEPEPAPVPEDLSPAALRRLADLEEARRRGEITEGQYQARRRELLEEEARGGSAGP